MSPLEPAGSSRTLSTYATMLAALIAPILALALLGLLARGALSGSSGVVRPAN